jgi:hypothetical protein
VVLARMHARVRAYEVVEARSFAHLLIQSLLLTIVVLNAFAIPEA